MNQKSIIVFVCEHGAAKSILAAAYFNKVASEMGLEQRAIARGTDPDEALSSQVVAGLSKDGLHPTESKPQKLTEADLQNAQHVISFCELPVAYRPFTAEQWERMPPVSENYEQARDAIIERIRQFLSH
jgi:protein-tyrosine-phosphatase